MTDQLCEVSPGVFLTDTRAAAVALFRDLADGWAITSQNGLIDCIEDHIKAIEDQAADRVVTVWLKESINLNLHNAYAVLVMADKLRAAIIRKESPHD